MDTPVGWPWLSTRSRLNALVAESRRSRSGGPLLAREEIQMGYNKAWEVGYVRDRAQGRRRYVPAAGTRAKLQALVDAHVPVRAIAQASGLSDTAVAHIIGGRQQRVQRQTATWVSSLTLNDVYARASGRVPSIGAVRRVQALMALGWRKADLEAEGIPSSQLITRSRDLISIDGWRQVREVYDRLSMTPGPARTARDRAAVRGYPPPLAWDDESIDDPRAMPEHGGQGQTILDFVAVDRVVTSGSTGAHCDTDLRLTQDERLEAIRELSTRGSSDGEIAQRLGVSDRTVLRLRHQHVIQSGHHATGPGSAAHERWLQDAPTGSERLSRSIDRENANARPGGQTPGATARAVGA